VDGVEAGHILNLPVNTYSLHEFTQRDEANSPDTISACSESLLTRSSAPDVCYLFFFSFSRR